MERPSRPPARNPVVALKRWRKAAGLDQLTAAARFGVSRQSYAKWEAGTKRPGMALWFRIHEVTGGSVPWHLWSKPKMAASLHRLVSATDPGVFARSEAKETA